MEETIRVLARLMGGKVTPEAREVFDSQCEYLTRTATEQERRRLAPTTPPAVLHAARKIIAGYHETQRLLPLAGGIPQPIERTDDYAVLLARWVLMAQHAACTPENCVIDGGPEHDLYFGA